MLLAWICGCTFIYNIIKNRIEQRTGFSVLLIATTITIVWNMTLIWVVSLYFAELYRLTRNGIDAYNPNEYQHTYIHKNCQIIVHVSQLFFSSSYILTLLMYFYRLYHLFADTTYTISKLRTKIFITLILLMTFCAISQVIFLFLKDYSSLAVAMIGFLMIYFVTSLYLIWNLNLQATSLKNTFNALARHKNKYLQAVNHLRMSIQANTNSSTGNNIDMYKTNAEKNQSGDKKMDKIIKVFVRLLLLAYTSIFSTLLVLIALIANFAAHQIVSKSKYLYITDLMYLSLNIGDGLINILCVSAQFENFAHFNCIYGICCKQCEKDAKLLRKQRYAIQGHDKQHKDQVENKAGDVACVSFYFFHF